MPKMHAIEITDGKRNRFFVSGVKSAIDQHKGADYTVGRTLINIPFVLRAAKPKHQQLPLPLWERGRVRLATKSTSPGAARQLVTFFCFAKKKVTKEKATPVCRRFAVPSISRKQAGLRNSTWRGAHPAPHCGTRTMLA
jgi:hypothetical protein